MLDPQRAPALAWGRRPGRELAGGPSGLHRFLLHFWADNAQSRGSRVRQRLLRHADAVTLLACETVSLPQSLNGRNGGEGRRRGRSRAGERRRNWFHEINVLDPGR